MNHFRLLSAQTHQRGERSPYGESRPIYVDLSKAGGGTGSAISVIIGSNGTGKSRLLGDIAESFLHLSGSEKRKRRMPLDSLAYEINGRFFQAGYSQESFFSLPVREIVHTRVIAVAMTPFDKFPLGPASYPEKADQPDFYHYIGMRDRMNRASVTALLYRSIEQLMRRRDGGSRSRIRGVFDLLGYEPVMTVGLRVDLNSHDMERAASKQLSFMDFLGRGFMKDRLGESLRSGRISESDLRNALESVSKYVISNRRIRIEINLDDPRSEFIDFDDFAFLRRVGLLRLESLEVRKLSGERIDLRSASSGEISIFTTFVAISSVLEDGSLVLIDEPETSLHPEWQKAFLDLLIRTFSAFEGCHFILSTHSPLIVGDTPIASSVYSMDQGQAIDGSEVSQKSPDYLLATAFHAATPTNSFVRDEIIRALRLAADGEQETEEYAATIENLLGILPALDENESVAALIRELAQGARRLDSLVIS